MILPNGKKIHTGGSSPDYTLNTWHIHKWGVGPYLEGMFSQSNYGIVTRAGIWLMPKPEAFVSYIFELNKEENFPNVIDAFRRLSLQGIVNTKLHLINDFVSLTIITQKKDETTSNQGSYTEDEIKKLTNKYKIAPWSGSGGLYGTKAEIRVQKKIMRKELKKYGRLLFFNSRLLKFLEKMIVIVKKNSFLEKPIRYFSGSSITMMEGIPHVHQILQGIPTEYFVNHSYFKHPLTRPTKNVNPARDNCGLIWFAPILPMTGKHLNDFNNLCKQKYIEYGFDFYVAILLLNPRSVVPLMSIIFDREKESEKAGQLYEALLELQYEEGYQQYRAGIKSWNKLFDNSPEYTEFTSKIKTALDPNNILSPNKYGVKHQNDLK